MKKTDLHEHCNGEQSVSRCSRNGESALICRSVTRIFRQTAGRYLLVAFALFLAFLISDCKKTGGGSGTYQVTFRWTPAGTTTQLGPMVVKYRFHCADPSSLPDCNILYFEDVGADNEPVMNNGDWMGYPEDKTNCSDFVAEVTDQSGAHFTFIGQIDSPLGGLRATGYYDKILSGGASELGTFVATCDDIQGGEAICD